MNMISFTIRYRCPKKGHIAKMDIMTQKMSHLNVHSPSYFECVLTQNPQHYACSHCVSTKQITMHNLKQKGVTNKLI
jgi:hypothetical protein